MSSTGKRVPPTPKPPKCGKCNKALAIKGKPMCAQCIFESERENARRVVDQKANG
jgi:hypothetical protein